MPKLDLFGMIVEDMAASLAFYRVLGLEIPAALDSEMHAEIVLPGGTRLAWDTQAMIRSFDEHWQPPTGGHGIAIAFRCESAEEVDTCYNQLVGQGYPSYKAPWDAVWGQRYAQILDPDGNMVDLFAWG